VVGEWTCICGSGDDGEWHTLACAISNTPEEVWTGRGTWKIEVRNWRRGMEWDVHRRDAATSRAHAHPSLQCELRHATRGLHNTA
jgi:hypothetical protein